MSGIDATVRITPDFSRFTAPRIPPIGVNVTPKMDQSALASIEAALRALPKAQIDADSTPAQQKVAELRARLEALRDKVVNLQVDDQQARFEMALVRNELDRIDSMNPSIDVQVDAAAASAALGRVEQEVSRVDGRTARLRAEIDIGQVVSSLAAVAIAVNGLDGRSANLRVVADTAGAIAGLAMVAVKAFALGGAVGGVAALGSAVAALGPAGAIAAGGLASAVLAFGGVGKALTALGAQQDSAGQDALAAAKKHQAAAQQQVAAAEQVESAQRRLTQSSQAASQARSDAAKNVARAETDSARQVAAAQQSAARSIASAEKQATAAHRTLRQATAELAREQKTLTAAWEAGKRSLQDLQDQVDGNALDQRQAAFDLKDAEKDLAAARATGNADQIARAQLQYDKQLETIDQLNKQTQRLGSDNKKAQAAGVAGSTEVVAANQRIATAQDRVTQASLAAKDADAAVNQARIDGANAVALAQTQGAQRVSDAREQGAKAIKAADLQVLESQRALTQAQRGLAQAMKGTGDEGSAAANKVKQAFANLSPAAAAFAMYLWSLKPAFDQLKASAAQGFFPPVQRGLEALMTQLPALIKIVGLFGAAMGGALGFVLTQLASPFWMGFFQTLANVAGPILMQFAQVFMQVAGAVAQVILALLPFTPAALGVLGLIGQLVAALAPFIGQLVGALIPAANAVVLALFPLGPVLAALGPILAVLATAFAQVLGAVLQALAPVVVALTPLIQQLATAFGASLANAIIGLTPFLVGLATFMSQHPQLVLTLIGVLGGLFTGFSVIKTVVGALLGPLMLMRLATLALGISAGTMGAAAGGAFAKVAGAIGGFVSKFSFLGLARTLLSSLGGALMGIGRAVLGAMGPVGWLITAFGLMYSTSAPFRDAVNQILGILGGLVGMIAQALMPILNALMGAFQTIVSTGVMPLIQQLAAALVPVLNMVAGVLMQLVQAVMPPLLQVFNAIAPVIGLVGQIIAQLFQSLAPLIPVVLMPLIMQMEMWAGIMQFLAPIIAWLANIISTVLVWAIQNVTIPILQFFMGIIQQVGGFFSWIGGLFSSVGSAIGVVWNALGSALSAVYTSVIQPVFQWFMGFLDRLGILWTFIFLTVIRPAWDAFTSALNAVYNAVVKPVFDAFMAVLRAVGDFFAWVFETFLLPLWNRFIQGLVNIYNAVLKPIFDAFMAVLRTVGDFFAWVFNSLVMPVWRAFTNGLRTIYDAVVKPVFDAFGGAVDVAGRTFGTVMDAVQRAWDRVTNTIKTVWDNTLGPIFSAIGKGLGAVGDAANWLFTGDPIGNANGGPVPGRARGGFIPGFAAGGSSRRRPKPGKSDTVPSLLTPGEFVMTRAATSAAGPKVMYGLMALLERKPAAAAALAELVTGLGVAGAARSDATGANSGPSGFALGGSVGGSPLGGAGASLPKVRVDADAGASGDVATQTAAMAGSMQAASLAAQTLNPALAGLATTQLGLLVPAQAAVALGQQAMAATVLGTLAPALGVYQQEVGVAAPLANQALQVAQLNTQLSTTATAANTQLNSQAMALSTMTMSQQSQLQHAGLRAGQVATQLSTNQTALTNTLANQNMVASTLGMSTQQQLQHVNLRAGQLLTRGSTDATSATNTLRNNEMMASTGLMSATNQNHLLNLRTGQTVTSQATTAFADAFKAQMARTQPDSGNPIKWVINYPLKSITDAWNNLDGQFALGKHVNPAVPNFATGGRIPGKGSGTADDVPIMASAGEFMVREKIAREHMPFLNALNSGQAEARQAAGGRRANPKGYAAGGVIAAQQYAKAQAGKPYVWGGVGPGGFDCSGLWSAITNVARGQAPNRRIGTAASNPWPGFTTGLNSALAVGANSSHMAGTIGGMNAEARTTGKPVYAGPPAVGADNGQFNVHASLPMVGGQFVSGGAGGGAGIDVGAVVNAAFAKATREVADVPKFFGPSAQVGRDQGVAKFGLDKVKGVATAKLSEMFAASGLWGPVGAGAPFIVKQISDAARTYGKGVDGATIGVATGLVESNLRNLPGGDRDSVGVFQQRPSMGWGTVAECMNVLHAAGSFFSRFPANWRNMVPGDVAQSVQRSGFPAKYQPKMAQARQLVGAHGGAFDKGGPLRPGFTLAYNGTGATETILDPLESKNYHRLGDLMGRGGVVRSEDVNDGSDGRGSAPLVGELHQHFHGDQDSQVAAGDLRHALRVVRAGGRPR